MRDDEDLLVLVSLRDPVQHADGPGVERVTRFAVLTVHAGEALLDLCPRETAPRADVDLAQIGVGGDLEPFVFPMISAVSYARRRSLE